VVELSSEDDPGMRLESAAAFSWPGQTRVGKPVRRRWLPPRRSASRGPAAG